MAALIWGTTFVAQSDGMKYIGPFTFICVRSLMSAAVLIPVIFFFSRYNKVSIKSNISKPLIIGGISCGTVLFFASVLQQIGIIYTTTGKAGFITTLYIVMVPCLGIFFKKKIPSFVWISVIIAVVGMYLLCIHENFSVSKGDFLILLCAVCFSCHILTIDFFVKKVDTIMLAFMQFLVNGILSAVAMFIFEDPKIENIIACTVPLLYAGILSGAVAFTFQIIAQKDTEPAVASLLMSLESVFAALAGWLILKEVLTPREIIGCTLIFTAILFAQIQPRHKLGKRKKFKQNTLQ